MPQKERLRVWKGEILKTSGGLKKEDLIKNKRGKIVSKRKSLAAKKKENNLGQWLRSKGDHFLSKGLTKEAIGRKKKGSKKDLKKESPKKDLKKEVPKISKVEPVKPGDKIDDKTKISVANIRRSKRVRKKRKLHNVSKL